MRISLENAKKLYEVAKEKEVKLPQGKFCWKPDVFGNKDWVVAKYSKDSRFQDFPFAYTTDELLEWLPAFVTQKIEDKIIPDQYIETNLHLVKTDGYYVAYYPEIKKRNGRFFKSEFNLFGGADKTSADALCKLAIKLIEEGIIK